MMRWKQGIALLGVGLSACSGKYEVGGMDAGGGSGTAGTVATAGSGATGATGTAGEASNPAGGAAPGGTGNAGPPTPAGECVPLGMPKALTGEFATPEVVWERITNLIWGGWEVPPSGYPDVTTPAWVNETVTNAFLQSQTVPQYMNGPRVFLVQWLNLPLGPDEKAVSFPFLNPWGPLLAEDKPALPILLKTSLGEPGREGIFTEPRWLAPRTSISSRGAGISASLMQNPPPSPPLGIENPEPDPNVTDRQALAMQIASPACAACHHIIDPLAFELGKFDAAGHYRELDHGQPVDTSGTVQIGNIDFSYEGLSDFNAQLADTCDANLALSDGFLRAALVINDVPGDREALFQANYERLRQAFYRGGRSYPDLVRAYAQSAIVLRP